MELAPIVLFAYKRLWHLQQTVDALKKNELAKDSNLVIYSDGAKNQSEKDNVQIVRHYLKTIRGFKSISIIERNQNLGLANSIITGVTEVLAKYRKIIVLEDDLISSTNFLAYINTALSFYEDNKNIFSVSGYNYPISIPEKYKDSVYVAYRCSSWGWGTWLNRWKKADWEVNDYKDFLSRPDEQKKFGRGGEDLVDMLEYQMKNYIDSWAIRWCYAHYKNDAFCLYPTVSKIKNIGLDRSGTHKTVRKIDIKLDTLSIKFSFPKSIVSNEEVLSNFSVYFKKSLKAKIIKRFKNIALYYLKYINKNI